MAVIEHLNPLLGALVVSALMSFYYLFSLLYRLRKLKLLSAVSRLTGLMFFALIATALLIILMGVQGYSALTKEQLAAHVKLTPYTDQSFEARLKLPDGSVQVFTLEGNQFMIDAYVLKWKNWAALFGLNTAYRLDRVSGRYRDVQQEKNNRKSVYAIRHAAGEGLAKWREEYSVLSVLLDVDHGSASFVSADQPAEFDLMVTTSGLLLRPVSFDESN